LAHAQVAQNPSDDEERETFVSVSCGPDGGTFEHFLNSGARVVVNERRYASAVEADDALERRLELAGCLISRRVILYDPDDKPAYQAVALDGTQAIRLERRDDWLHTTTADSLDDLATFDEEQARKALRRTMPPN
jgi:hypothetical protein